jgi:hypothetical protein
MSEVSVSKAPSTKEFWESSELLRMVKRVADKTRKSAYAILGWLMVDVLTRISYQTHYVSEVGRASLNMLFLMSAPTGGGKSAARKVAKEHFAFALQNLFRLARVRQFQTPITSDSKS